MKKLEPILDAIEISASILNSEKNLSKKIDQILETIGKAIDADRAYIFKNFKHLNGSRRMRYTHEWYPKNVSPYINNGVIDTLNWNNFPEIFARLAGKESINDLVVNSSNEVFKENMEIRGIASYLFIPIMSGKKFWGHFGFDFIRTDNRCSNKEVSVLTAIALTLGNTILTKRTNKKLKQTKINYLWNLNSLPIVIFYLDLDYRIIFLNNHWETYSGYKINEALGKEIYNFIVDEKKLTEQLNQIGVNGLKKTISTNLAIRKKQGDQIYAKLTLSKVMNDQQKLLRISGSLIDISKENAIVELNTKPNLSFNEIENIQLNTLYDKRKKEESKYLLKTQLNISTSPFKFISEVVNKQSNSFLKTQTANNATWSLEIQKLYDEDFLSKLEFSDPDSLVEITLLTKEIHIDNDINKDPKAADFHGPYAKIERFLGIPIENNGNEFTNGPSQKQFDYFLPDPTPLIPQLTAASKKDEGLTISTEKNKIEKYYRIIAENTPNIITILDENLNFIFVSPSIKKKFGISPSELIGKNCKEIVENFNVIFLVQKDKSKVLYNFPVKNSDRKVVMESRIKPIRDEFKNLNGYLVIGIDMTERESLYENLKESLAKEKELSDLKSKFISMASHEFRTPLATILSSAQIISFNIPSQLNEASKKKIETHLERISIQTKQLVKIISDILLLGASSNSYVKPNLEKIYVLVFLFELINEYYSDRKENNNIVLNLPKYDFELTTDVALFTHIIKNLIDNAKKYSLNASLPIELNITKYNNVFIFKIRDYGIGIQEQDKKYIFDSFYRGKNVSNIKGTGLGLNIVKEFSAKLGYEVTFESEENKGTTVSLKIPYESKINSN